MKTVVTIDGLGTLELLRSKRAWQRWKIGNSGAVNSGPPPEYPCLAFIWLDAYEEGNAGYIYHADAAAMLRVLETGGSTR
jgi:hypothetical protein